jgi:OOP family OmpA-OmpF porin
MQHPLRSAVAAVLAAVTGTAAWAGQDVGDTYVVPQVGYTWLDDDRAASDDTFLGIALGRHFSEAVSLELGVSEGTYDFGADQELELRAYSLDALFIVARKAVVSPYFTAGVGLLRNEPQGADKDHHKMAQAGIGFFINIAEKANGSMKFALRPEAKARWAFPSNNDPQDKYLDYLAGLGFQFSFGEPRPEPPPPTPPPPPPPPPPTPEPPRDSDGDGVIDPRDKCPDTPRGVAVDADGCPRRGTATLQGVTFEYNSSNLTADSRPVLNEVAADLKRYPRLKVELQGHTDSVGSDAYNMKLSAQRANSVRVYLVSQGVPEQQLTSRGFGETQPAADNKTEEGRAQNRRVVMNVLDNPGDVDVTVQPPAP